MSSLDLVHSDEGRALPALPAPVPRAFTHKRNPSEVLLTSWRRTGRDTFSVEARWPRDHTFYTHRNGLLDPLLLSESVRQTLPLLSHAAYDVPLGHHLLWQHLRWELDPAAARDEGQHTDIELRITATDVKYRGSRAAAMDLHVQAWRQGARRAEVRTCITIQDRRVYERLRGRYADVGLANARGPSLSHPRSAFPGRTHGATRTPCSLARTARTAGGCGWTPRTRSSSTTRSTTPRACSCWRRRVRPRTAPRARATAVVGMEAAFLRYAELDAPCWIEAQQLPDAPAGRQRVLVTARQHDEEIFTDVVTLGEL
jgi:hypothetical protein